MIAQHILALCAVLSVTWGIYLLGTIRHYVSLHRTPDRRRAEAVRALRDVMLALNVWLFVFSFVFRTACVLVGIGEEVAAQIVFFALAGTNLVGSLWAGVSLRYD